MRFQIDAQIDIIIDTQKMKDVPDDKIEQVIGQILVRFSKWNCDRLTILSEGHNNLFCQFYFKDKIRVTMGAIWRGTEFTFHT